MGEAAGAPGPAPAWNDQQPQQQQQQQQQRSPEEPPAWSWSNYPYKMAGQQQQQPFQPATSEASSPPPSHQQQQQQQQQQRVAYDYRMQQPQWWYPQHQQQQQQRRDDDAAAMQQNQHSSSNSHQSASQQNQHQQQIPQTVQQTIQQIQNAHILSSQQMQSAQQQLQSQQLQSQQLQSQQLQSQQLQTHNLQVQQLQLQQQGLQHHLAQAQALQAAQAAKNLTMPRPRPDIKPRGRITAYAFFVQTCREEHKKKHPEENVIFADFSKKCAERWKTMVDKEKQRFHEMAERDKKRYDMEMQAYTPPKGEKFGRGRKRKQFKDPNAPKRSLSAFFWFCNDERSKVKALNPEFGVGSIAKELGKRWADCDPTTKGKYEALSEKDKARYDREMTAYKKGIKIPPMPQEDERDELNPEEYE